MRNGIAVVSLTCFGLSFWLGTLSAYASDDLILPPDLRGSTPAASSTYPSSPKLAPKHAKAPLPKTSPKREAPVTAAQSEPAAPSPKVQKQNSGDDPLSFGMKWNADQTASGPGSLSDELNKNINGATIGTGAEVGVKYKF
jgi:hypothetical protein